MKKQDATEGIFYPLNVVPGPMEMEYQLKALRMAVFVVSERIDGPRYVPGDDLTQTLQSVARIEECCTIIRELIDEIDRLCRFREIGPEEGTR